MKILLQHLFTYSFILFALSLALPGFGQDGTPTDGPPNVRKEATDGDGPFPEDCHLLNNGEDQNLNITVYYTTDPDYIGCDLHIGYRLKDQQYTYVKVNLDYNNGVYSVPMTIPFTAEEIAWRCENELFEFRIGLYCLVNGVYEAILPASTDNTLNICCDEIEPHGLPGPEGSDDVPGFPTKTNTDIDVFEIEIDKNSGENVAVDYHLYDLHGNHIKILKNVSPSNSIQEIITDLPIKSGIYFVRYLDKNKIQTKKVFKN